METILILGLVLFVLCVAGTIVHDKYKIVRARNVEQKAKVKAAKNRSAAQEWGELMAQARGNIKSLPKQPAVPTTKRVVKPGSVKTGYHKPGNTPTETEAMTLDELIKHIESLKKK